MKISEWFTKFYVGGCHVPGLYDSPDPVGSEDLEKKSFKKKINDSLESNPLQLKKNYTLFIRFGIDR